MAMMKNDNVMHMNNDTQSAELTDVEGARKGEEGVLRARLRLEKVDSHHAVDAADSEEGEGSGGGGGNDGGRVIVVVVAAAAAEKERGRGGGGVGGRGRRDGEGKYRKRRRWWRR